MGDEAARGGNAAERAERQLRLKRMRQRMYVKQAYDRQKEMMARLKRQAESLEAQYSELLGQSLAAASGGFEVKEESGASSPASERLLLQYAAVTKIKRALYMENEALQAANSLAADVSQRVERLLEAKTPPFHFQPLTLAEYEAVVASARVHVLQVLDIAAEQASNGKEVMGWIHRRCTHKGVHSVLLGKHFIALSARELFRRSWAILSTPAKYAQLFSPYSHAELHLLQHVDDDTLLFYTEMDAAHEAARAKSVFLLHRETYAKGHLILIRSIDPPRLAFDNDGINGLVEDVRSVARGDAASPMAKRYWIETFTWLAFEETCANACGFQFGNSLPVVWALEVLMMAMRWQILAVGHEQLLHAAPDQDVKGEVATFEL